MDLLNSLQTKLTSGAKLPPIYSKIFVGQLVPEYYDQCREDIEDSIQKDGVEALLDYVKEALYYDNIYTLRRMGLEDPSRVCLGWFTPAQIGEATIHEGTGGFYNGNYELILCRYDHKGDPRLTTYIREDGTTETTFNWADFDTSKEEKAWARMFALALYDALWERGVAIK